MCGYFWFYKKKLAFFLLVVCFFSSSFFDIRIPFVIVSNILVERTSHQRADYMVATLAHQ